MSEDTSTTEKTRTLEEVRAEALELEDERTTIEERDDRGPADHERLREITERLERLSDEALGLVLDRLLSGGTQDGAQTPDPLQRRVSLSLRRAAQLNRALALEYEGHLSPVGLAGEQLVLKGVLEGLSRLLQDKGIATREELRLAQARGVEHIVDHEVDHHLSARAARTVSPRWSEGDDTPAEAGA